MRGPVCREAYPYRHAHTYTRKNTHTHTQIHIHIHTYTRTRTHTHTGLTLALCRQDCECVFVCARTCVRVCMCVCVRARACVRVCLPSLLSHEEGSWHLLWASICWRFNASSTNSSTLPESFVTITCSSFFSPAVCVCGGWRQGNATRTCVCEYTNIKCCVLAQPSASTSQGPLHALYVHAHTHTQRHTLSLFCYSRKVGRGCAHKRVRASIGE